MKHVVVTGISTGIGWNTAKVLTENGFHVFGSVRTEKDATRIKADFGDRVTPLVFDVVDETSIRRAAEQVRTALAGQTLDGLVNNAGIAVSGPLIELPVADFRHQLEVNVTGTFLVTQAFAPLLGADRSLTGKPGRIVNISSVGGKVGAPFVGPYIASKFAVEGMSESLRRELLLFGIDVIIVGPGAVSTPIWDKAGEADISGYSRSPYAQILKNFQAYFIKSGREGLPPERIGMTVLKALTTAHPRIRYAVVPKPLMNWYLPRLLPRRFVDRVVGRALGLLPK